MEFCTELTSCLLRIVSQESQLDDVIGEPGVYQQVSRENYWELRRVVALPFCPTDGLCLGGDILSPMHSEHLLLNDVAYDVNRRRFDARVTSAVKDENGNFLPLDCCWIETNAETIEASHPGWVTREWRVELCSEGGCLYLDWPKELRSCTDDVPICFNPESGEFERDKPLTPSP